MILKNLLKAINVSMFPQKTLQKQKKEEKLSKFRKITHTNMETQQQKL